MNCKVGGALRSLGKTLSFHSTRSRSSSQAPSRAGFEMDIDLPSPSEHHTLSSRSQCEERYELTSLNQILLPLRPQVEILNVLKTNEFTHTPIFDSTLLHETRMDYEFELIFRMIGLEDAWEINE